MSAEPTDPKLVVSTVQQPAVMPVSVTTGTKIYVNLAIPDTAEAVAAQDVAACCWNRHAAATSREPNAPAVEDQRPCQSCGAIS